VVTGRDLEALAPPAIGDPFLKTALKDLLVPEPKESPVAFTRLAVRLQRDVDGQFGFIPTRELCGLKQVTNFDIGFGQRIPYEEPSLGKIAGWFELYPRWYRTHVRLGLCDN
jgi:hypothetical protein